MHVRFPYSATDVLELELPDDVVVADCAANVGEPVADVAAAIRQGLAQPEGYPPLAGAVVPGDRVAVVLDEGLPQPAAIVAGATAALVHSGVDPKNIAIVQTQQTAQGMRENACGHLSEPLQDEVSQRVHDPTDPEQLAYLATSKADEAIYLNRDIFEADLVLPVTCVRPLDAPGYHGAYGSLFPAFSSAETIRRFASAQFTSRHVESYDPQHTAQGHFDHLLSDEVGWLLGVRLLLQVIPGPRGTVQAVICGDVDIVEARSRTLCDRIWRPTVPALADLVIASLTNPPQQQSWQSVAAALQAAGTAVSPGGAIALFTDLEEPPSEAVLRLLELQDSELIEQEVAQDRSADAQIARQLARALQRGPLFLKCRLDEELVEQMGIAPLGSAEQIARLASRFPSCTFLPHAQWALPALAEQT